MRKAQGTTLDSGVYEGLAAFRYALRRFLAFSEAATKAAGVTSQQYQALLVIRAHPGAVQMIDRLARAQLVERRDSPSDRRSVLVALTARGAKLLQHLASEHLAELRRQEPLLVESLERLRRVR
jgi:DNA-binding MarR family transcriptional regulator